MTTLGDLLDLLAADRDSDEIVRIMGAGGNSEMIAPVCSRFWSAYEDRVVGNIEADARGVINVWLKEETEA